MATLILGAAGAGLGAAVAGPAGALLGRAAGGVAGALIDQRLLGGGARSVRTAPPPGVRVQSGREGAPMARVYGRMRVVGHVIWASDYRESFEGAGGGKAAGLAGGSRPETRRVFVSLAVALCEGPIDRLGRVWADGRLLARDVVDLRLHRGEEDQPPDPLMLAAEGSTPAFRGVAYVVFEDLDLSRFGGRIPQLSFEVFRQPRVDRTGPVEFGRPLAELVRGVALSPGSGEFSLETRPVRRRLDPGVSRSENAHGPDGRADILAALDQLEEEAPACKSVLLLSTWFGDDLRCGKCRIEPRVETRDKQTEPVSWAVAGLGRSEARVVGLADERPVFGGTPSDAGVVAAIRELRSRGLRTVFYPFLMMEVAPGSGLPDPWGGAEQSAYPWRGRVSASVAPGLPESPDGSPEVAAEVAAFFGDATAGDFEPAGDMVVYRGPPEWSFRRFVLHYAHLCRLAGGVGAFCIGSEMRGLTTLRAGPGLYPAVEAFRALARDVRTVLGPSTRIGYAADWSEYFGHQPADGSGDVVFHLDSLWADPNIDFVGIDNYMPIADWRGEIGEADAAYGGPHALSYLRAGVAGGEGWDWHYATVEDRAGQRRTPITDGAHGEPWVFRYKDIGNWWARPHYNRIGGVRAESPTEWAPCSKPIWFTEIGCPAVDKGANQPNLFVDPKSSESGLPHFSTGLRDDAAQRRYLQATLGYWSEPFNNPASPLYDGRMVDTDAIHVWTWDARPWPEFPARRDVWGDGDNHARGHWINGRMASADLAEIVSEICAGSGVAADVSMLSGLVPGYLVEETQTARQALQPLMLAYGFDIIESGAGVRCIPRDSATTTVVTRDDCVESEDGPSAAEVVRTPSPSGPSAMRYAHLDGDGAYETAVAEARGPAASIRDAERVEAALALDAESAATIASRLLAEASPTRASLRMRLPPSRLALEPGDVVRLADGPDRRPFRVERVTEATWREIEAAAVAPAEAGTASVLRRPLPSASPLRHPPEIVVMETPAPDGDDTTLSLTVAAFAEPWTGPLGIWRSERSGGGWRLAGVVSAPATMGEVIWAQPAPAAHRWAPSVGFDLRLWGGTLNSATRRDVLDGSNMIAIEGAAGWELAQFATAEMTGSGRWRLSGMLRGQCGTAIASAPPGARVVLLDQAPCRLALPAGEAGLTRRLRIGPLAFGHDDEACVVLEATAVGVGCRPLAPSHLRLRSQGETVVALWTPRGRLDLDGWEGADGAGAPSSWRVTVRVGGREACSETVGVPRFAYGPAERAADGVTGPFTVAVAQVSSVWGDGPELGVAWHG